MTSLAMFRMRNRSLAVKNLYITGASTHFGGGVPPASRPAWLPRTRSPMTSSSK